MSSEPTKILAPVQAYWKKHNDDTIPIYVLARWKEDQGIIDNTEHLGEDEGLTEIQQLTKDQQKAKDEALYKSIPWAFRSKVIRDMYESEPQDIKDLIDTERTAGVPPLENEVDLEIRKLRLLKADR